MRTCRSAFFNTRLAIFFLLISIKRESFRSKHDAGTNHTRNAVPKDHNEIMRSVSASVRSLRQDTPAVIAGFNALADAAMHDGELSKTTKELIALALGVAGTATPASAFT